MSFYYNPVLVFQNEWLFNTQPETLLEWIWPSHFFLNILNQKEKEKSSKKSPGLVHPRKSTFTKQQETNKSQESDQTDKAAGEIPDRKGWLPVEHK